MFIPVIWVELWSPTGFLGRTTKIATHPWSTLGHPGTGDSQSGLHGSQFDVHSAEKWLGGCQHLQLSGEAKKAGGAAGT